MSWFLSACAAKENEPIVVDEPSVRLEAELNLHYKSFSDVTLTPEYVRRWRLRYGYLPGSAPMTDSEIFEALDLGFRGLGRVKASLGNRDVEGAKEALADYFAHRPSPCFMDTGPLNPSGRAKALAVADECLEHPDFPTMRWPREKFGRGSKDSRWNWVGYLFTAYRHTRDVKYLLGALKMFSCWYETVRPPAGKPGIWLTPSFIDNPWGSHLASGRLYTIALMDGETGALARAGSGEGIPHELAIPLYKSVAEHARFLIAVNPGFRSGNIQIAEMMHLLEAGVYFPEFKEARDWVDFSWKRLLKHAWLDLMPDGGHYERAGGYNNGVVRDFRRVLELARVAELETPGWLRPKLEKAHEWTVKIYTPILNIPPVGDGGMGPKGYALRFLVDGALLFPRPSFKHFVKDHPGMVRERAAVLFREGATEALAVYDAVEPAEPPYTSVNLPDTGWAVMRSGWDRDARYLLFDYGTNEPWHAHRDGLGFSIFAWGEPLITDSGHGGSYESDRSKQWYKETVSHNLVVINGMSQRKVTGGQCDRWICATSADYADAVHDGYKYLGAYHRRKITFVKPDYWIITDNITEKMCQTSGYHECSWLAHFQPTELSVDEKTKRVHTNNPRANVLLVPSRPGDLELVRSKGWMITPSGEVDDAPNIAFKRESDPPVDYEVVVFPYKGTQVPHVKVERLDLGEDAWRCKGLRITTPGGVDYYLESLSADYYVEVGEKSRARRFGDFTFDGEMALIRMTRDGGLKSALVVGEGGVKLACKGEVIAECPETAFWAETSGAGKAGSPGKEGDR